MSCKVTPKVKNSQGELITAPLYINIRKIVGPFKALDIFNKAVSKEAKENEDYNKLSFDEYNMPTIESLLEYTDLDEYLDNIYYGNELSKELFGKQSVSFYSGKEVLNMFDKIIEFNNSNNRFNAFFVKNVNENKYELTIVKRNKYSQDYLNNLEIFVENAKKAYIAMKDAGFDDHYISNQISFAYNIKYVKQLSSSEFNPNLILDNTIKLSKKEGITPQSINYLLNSDLFNKSQLVERFDINLRSDLDFTYNFLIENNLINSNEVSKEDVLNKKEFRLLVRNYILAKALSNAFSLSDAKNNNHLYEIINRLQSEISSKLSKIDISPLKKENHNKPEVENIKRDIKLSFKTMLKDIESINKDKKDDFITGDKTLEKLINAEKMRLNLAVRQGNTKEAGIIKKKINNLISFYESNNFNMAFLNFLKEQGEEIQELYSKIKESMDKDSLSQKTYKVRNLLQLCKYYSNCIEYFNEYMSKNSTYKEDLENEINNILKSLKVTIDFNNPNEIADYIKKFKELSEVTKEKDKELSNIANTVQSLLNSYNDVVKNPVLKNSELSGFTQLVNEVTTETQKYALSITADFIEQFENEDAKIIPWGKSKDKKINIEDELRHMKNDINFYDLYLDAMADCPDRIIRLTDKAIKTTKNNVRLKVLELAREIKKEASILRKSGITDFSWMYEKDKNGKKTGNYLLPENPDFNKIVDTEAKKRFYVFFIKTKAQIDSYYPNNDGSFKIIGIRKDRLERLKNSKNIKDFGTQIWEGIKDNWLDREDDDDIAGYEEMFTDIGGNEIKLLPIYYNNVHEGNADHMSEDAVTTLIAYANKGIEYHEMASLVNSIELEREVLKQREMPVMSGGKKILNIAMRKVYSENPDLIKQNEVTQKDLGRSNVYKMFDEHIDMALYGRFRKKEKNLGPLSTAKIIDQLNKKTAISALSLNLLNGISNVLTGTSITRIEAICQQYFSVKDLAWADLTYNKEMPSYLSEKGNNIKESKLHLFIEQFDVIQDFDTNINETDWMKDTWFKKMVNSEFMSVIQNAGEHYMNTRIALALAHSMKFKTKYGKETTLWEMLDIEYLQEDGTYGKDDKKLGARLKLKEECYNKDGSEFKLDNSNIQKITRKMAGINQGIHGIYNKQDANLIQTYSVGRLIYMFRKWIPKSIDKRFANLKYNYDVEDWTEGYYQTAFRFLYGLIKEHNGMKLEIGIRWNQLDERQKANCKRALAETVQFFGLLLLNSYGFKWRDDDKSGYSWLQNMAYYQSIRLQSELAALEPLSLLGSRDNMATEFTRMFKNPIAAMSPVSDALKLQQLFFPSTWIDTVQRGPYKGHSKAFVVFWGNKFLFPIGAMIPKNVGPENYVGYYLNN